jgi:hypothetical protein
MTDDHLYSLSPLGQDILEGLHETLEMVQGRSVPARATLMAGEEHQIHTPPYDRAT